jgi:ketopantoate hydroxymethyltransferase
MAKRVLVVARDLMFRSKLRAVLAARGAESVADESSCDLAVVEIEAPQWEERVRALTARGIPVLAFGSHVHADLLRLARDAGAQAVPNSQVERALTNLLG